MISERRSTRHRNATVRKAERVKGLYFDGEKAVYREDLPKPVCGEGESLIRILMAAICNTDREVLKGYRPDFRGVMGHEFVGVVERSEDESLIGKRVVGELNAGCGHCLYCRTGREKHCPDRKVIGMEGKDGCFAEYMTLQTHLIHRVPEALPTEKAIFTEPLAAAFEITSQVHISPDTKVAVLGDGRLSLMITQVLNLTGTDLTVIGKHPEKLEKFRTFAKTGTEQTVTEAGETFEIIVDATGAEAGLQLAKRLIRRQGTIILKSTYAGKANVDMSYFVVNEITIKGSRCGPFEPALRMLAQKRITLPEIELFDLKDHEKAFAYRGFKAGFRF